MNIEEARKHIGKEVVLDESTKPYKFLNGGDIPKQIIESFIGTRATIAQINSLGSVEIDFTLSDGSSDYWWFNPHHLKIKEKPMKKYKIRVTPETSGEVQKLFFELGCSWSSNINQPKYLNDRFLYTENGLISATNDYGIFIDSAAKDITIHELRDMVVLKRNDVGDATHVGRSGSEFYRGLKDYFFNGIEWVESQLDDTSKLFLEPIEYNRQITWQDAYIAMANGQEVQVWIADGDRWETINHYDNWSIAELAQEKLRLETKPPQVKIESPPWEFADMTWKDALRAVADGKEVEFKKLQTNNWDNIGELSVFDIVGADCKFRLKPQTTHIEGGDYTKEELLKIAGEM